MSDNKVQMTFIQKLENFWYHYKWHALFGAFALILAIVCFVQCMGRTEPDAMVMYVGEIKNMLIPAEDNRDQSLEDDVMAEDYNGDGEKRVEVFQLIIPLVQIGGEYAYDDAVAQTNNSERQRMYTEVATGASVVYILHPYIYEEVKNMEVLRPLTDVLDDVPEYAVDEYGVPISELIAYRMTNLRYYPEDSIICIRRERTKDSGSMNPDDADYYANNVEFFRDVIEY